MTTTIPISSPTPHLSAAAAPSRAASRPRRSPPPPRPQSQAAPLWRRAPPAAPAAAAAQRSGRWWRHRWRPTSAGGTGDQRGTSLEPGWSGLVPNSSELHPVWNWIRAMCSYEVGWSTLRGGKPPWKMLEIWQKLRITKTLLKWKWSGTVVIGLGTVRYSKHQHLFG